MESQGPVFDVRACRSCGCTTWNACWHEDEGTCAWAEADLCTACAPGASEGWEHPVALEELGYE